MHIRRKSVSLLGKLFPNIYNTTFYKHIQELLFIIVYTIIITLIFGYFAIEHNEYQPNQADDSISLVNSNFNGNDLGSGDNSGLQNSQGLNNLLNNNSEQNNNSNNSSLQSILNVSKRKENRMKNAAFNSDKKTLIHESRPVIKDVEKLGNVDRVNLY